MLPMIMHRKQERDRRKRRHSNSVRLAALEQMLLEQGVAAAGPSSFVAGATATASSPLYENVTGTESAPATRKVSAITQATRKISAAKSKRRCHSTGSAQRSKISRSNLFQTPSMSTSDHTDDDIIRTKRPIDMRPLSIPPPEVKRRSPAETCCYVVLGIATIVVFGIAFTIWLKYDSLAKFVNSLTN